MNWRAFAGECQIAEAACYMSVSMLAIFVCLAKTQLVCRINDLGARAGTLCDKIPGCLYAFNICSAEATLNLLDGVPHSPLLIRTAMGTARG